MNLLSSSISVITLQQPRMRKGSFASLIGAMPLLDVFVAGPENQLVAECLSPFGIEQLASRSPLFLYGPSGSGKTALALTIAARWINEVGERTITLTSGSDFSKAFTRAIEADDMDRFRQLHRECDCLLVDNIHELASKPAAQEEMVSTIERLHGDGKLIVVTAPELAPLTPNLRLGLASRLNGGHSVPVSLPSAATRKEILRLLAVHSQIDICEADLDAIGAQLQDGMSPLQLRGILIRWSHHNRMTPERTQKESKRLIDNLVDAQVTKAPSVADIAKAVGRELQITMDLLRGPGRKSSVVRARGLAMFLIRQWTVESYQNIGVFFGGRDHTTVMHACKKTEEDLANDHELTRTVDRVRQRLKLST
ncbi:MAG: DnaA/Hda family protein [Planctomycetota bacterium]|nr:DnaA/Hda family protein [Planctomycetota bacterium]